MSVVQVPDKTPLYHSLYPQIQAKVSELGWTSPEDPSLTEFILLTLGGGKTQETLYEEVKDLLEDSESENLTGFTHWLVEKITTEAAQADNTTGAAPPQQPSTSGVNGSGDQVNAQDGASADGASGEQDHGGMDEDMSEVPTGPANGAIPSGPKSMQGPARGGRGGRGGRASMNAPETSLHRIKGTANAGRINSHSGRDSPRGVPRGPRGGFRQNTGRGGMNGVNIQAVQQAAQPVAAMPSFTPEQQSFVANMMTENMQMLASMFAQQQQQTQMSPGGGGFNMGGPGAGGPRGRGGRSLFDRVEGRNQRGGGHHQKQQQQAAQNGESQNGDSVELTSSMEVETNSQTQRPDASSTLCKFNLFCTKPDCTFAHQSPAAPPSTEVDMSDDCKYGASCKNRKCAGKHPSPASAAAQQEPPLCKYFPNCQNPYCTFLHPAGPPCRNGADCTTPNCPFTHNPTPCRFNPCTNPSCQFKHAEGQKQVADKAAMFSKSKWVNPELRGGSVAGSEDHMSERKFIDENAAEEVIIPGSSQPSAEPQAEDVEVS